MMTRDKFILFKILVNSIFTIYWIKKNGNFTDSFIFLLHYGPLFNFMNLKYTSFIQIHNTTFSLK